MVFAGTRRERDLFSVKPTKILNKLKYGKNKSKSGGEEDESEKVTRKKTPKTKKQKIVKIINSQPDCLSYESLSQDQCILGCVMEVQKFELLISLPNKIVGYVPISNISHAYKTLLAKVSNNKVPDEAVYELKDLYQVGQLLVTKVKSLISFQNHKVKVILSILPGDVNSGLAPSNLRKGSALQGAVAGTEDKGYIIETGIHNMRAAFLPNSKIPEGTYGVGTVLLCCIKKILDYDEEEGQMRVKLTAMSSYMVNHSLSLGGKSSSVAVIPGSLLNASVHKVVNDGLLLSTSHDKAFVSQDHLDNLDSKLSKYKVNDKVVVRLLYISKQKNILHCTLNSILCQGNFIFDSENNLKIGAIVEKAEITKNDKSGVYFRLSNGSYGFSSANKFSDSKVKRQANFDEIQLGDRKIVRIIQISMMDQIYIVTFKKSLVNAKIFGTSDLKVGDKVSGTIVSHTKDGAIVSLSRSVKGFVPSVHFTNISSKLAEEKGLVEREFDARIIKHIVGENPHLTLNEELVNSELPIVDDFVASNVGVVTIGTLVHITDTGLLLELFADAKVFIPIHEIPYIMTKDIFNKFIVGSVIKCKIIKVDTSSRKMIASLKFAKDPTFKVYVPKLVTCTVSSVDSDCVYVDIDNYNECGAYIPLCHLNDNLEYCKSIFKLLKEGDRIRNAIVMKKEDLLFMLSLKSSFVHTYADAEKKFSLNIMKNAVFPSVVTQCLTSKIKVWCLNDKNGSVHEVKKSNIVEDAIRDVSHIGIVAGQSLILRCLRHDDPKTETVLSSQLKFVVPGNKEKHSLQLLYNNLMSEHQIHEALKMLSIKRFIKVNIGKRYICKVKSVTTCGSLVNIPSLRLDGVISPAHYDKSPTINESMKVKILHINYKEFCLELTAKLNFKKILAPENPKVTVGEECICEVMLCKKEFILARLKTVQVGQLIYLPSKRHINDFVGRHYYYEVGKKYKIRIRYIENGLILASLLAHCPKVSDSEEEKFQLNRAVSVIDVVNPIPLSSLRPLVLNKQKLTNTDFYDRASNKIMRVTRDMRDGSSIKSSIDKFSRLEKDEIPQYDKNIYRKAILKIRKERKKDIKIRGFIHEHIPKTVPQKRKMKETVEDSPRKKSKKEMNGYSNEAENDDTTNNWNEELNYDTAAQNNKSDSSSCLQVSSKGFDWTGEAFEKKETPEESSDDEDGEQTVKGKQKTIKRLSKFERVQLLSAEEKKTRELELQRLDPDRQPETALDFEENIEINPHSAATWIEYVSFHLENAETEKAKGVAARALTIIPPTLEEERLSIWNVILRLEVMYGTPESVQDSFKEAIVTNDELRIFYMMVDIYGNTNKFKEAEETIKSMTKKFSEDKEVWIKAGLFFFKAKCITQARNVLDRSLLSLPKPDHVYMINRFAQFELNHGDPERGRTLFETLLSNFPKRMDIWNIYADLLVKQKDLEGARNVLERMTGLKLKMNAMRTVFKKLLEFEKVHGTPQRIEAVKAKVEEYVTSALKRND